MDIYCLRISIAECPCMDIPAWISMWISTVVWIIQDWHPKIMDIHVDIRRFLEIHAWICHMDSRTRVRMSKIYLKWRTDAEVVFSEQNLTLFWPWAECVFAIKCRRLNNPTIVPTKPKEPGCVLIPKIKVQAIRSFSRSNPQYFPLVKKSR